MQHNIQNILRKNKDIVMNILRKFVFLHMGSNDVAMRPAAFYCL